MRLIPVGCLMLLFGCGGVNPGKNPDPVELTGQVTVDGKAVNKLTLNLQPTGRGLPASLPIVNSAVHGAVTPGKYTYYLSDGSSGSPLAAIPEKYREGSLQRQIEITDGGQVHFAFE